VKTDNEKIVAIVQPNFLPWIGYFEMGHRADVFVMLDDVQFVRREWVNRNKILNRSEQGWQWLTVPINNVDRNTKINQIEIHEHARWVDKAITTIRHVYCKAPYFSKYFEEFESVLNTKYQRLLDFNVSIIQLVYRILGIDENLVLSSKFDINYTKDDKLLAICSELGATIYLANNGSMDYIDMYKFTGEGIGFVFQDYQHPEYEVKGFKFQPYMSVIDLIFWQGQRSLDLIISGREENWREAVKR